MTAYFSGDLIDDLRSDDDLTEILTKFEDEVMELIDRNVSVYTSDLTNWLNENQNNVYYITEAQEENPQTDGFKILQSAQFKAIEELYMNALQVIKKVIE